MLADHKGDQKSLYQKRLDTEDTKKCPYCVGFIRKEAKVCRYCQRELKVSPTNAASKIINIMNAAERGAHSF
jgi:hypothetical protein